MWYALLYLATLYAVRASAFVLGDPNHFNQVLRAKYIEHLWLVRCHGVTASLLLMLGPWLLSSRIRHHWPQAHRRLGKLYLLLLVPAASTGFVMSSMAFGGLPSQSALSLLSLAWIFTALQAGLALRRRRLNEHRDWMIRHYALTFAAVSLRIQTAWRCGMGEDFSSIYWQCAWLSWVLNLVLAEVWIRWQRKSNPPRSPGRWQNGRRFPDDTSPPP